MKCATSFVSGRSREELRLTFEVAVATFTLCACRSCCAKALKLTADPDVICPFFPANLDLWG